MRWFRWIDGVEVLVVEREIRRRLADYCAGIDRCDEAMVASVFHEDSKAEYGAFDGTGAQFAALTCSMLRDGAHATMHRMGEPRIDHGEQRGVAESETPVFAQHVVDPPGIGGGPGHEAIPADQPRLECFAGWYFDRFEKRNGDWLIAHRRLVHAWDTVLPINPAFPDGTFDHRLPERGWPGK